MSSPHPRRSSRPAKKRTSYALESNKENTTPSPSHKRSRQDLDWNTTDSEHSDDEDSMSNFTGSPPKQKKARLSNQNTKPPTTTTKIKKPRKRAPRERALARAPRRKSKQLPPSTSEINTTKGAGVLIARAGTYSFHGTSTKCIHTSPASWKDVDWKAPGAHEHTLDESCLALQKLNMAIYKPLNLVLCKEHHYLFDASSFRSHVGGRTHSTMVPSVDPTEFPSLESLAKTFPKITTKKVVYLVRHIQNAFQLANFADISASLPFSSPLPFLLDPVLFWRCPNCQLPFQAEMNRIACVKYQEHFKNNPDCQKKATARLGRPTHKQPVTLKDMPTFLDTHKYGHEVYHGNNGKRAVILLYPDGFSPTTTTTGRVCAVRTVVPMPESTAIHDQGYAKTLQWDTAFVRFSKQKEPEKGWEDTSKMRVLDLHRLLNSAPVQGLSDQETLESGLAEVWIFLYDYIFSANAWLKTCSRILRNRLTEGTKSRYRDLVPSTMLTYRKALFDPLCLLMWSWNAAAHAKPVASRVGDFLHLNKNAKKAAKALYDFLTTGGSEDFPREKLAALVHELLVLLLVSQTDTTHIVGGPFDIALILSAYIPSSQTYGPPTIPNRYCAWLQYDMRSIAVHLIRLGGFDRVYKPFEPMVANMDSTDDWGLDDGDDDAPPKDPLDLCEEDMDQDISEEDDVNDSNPAETWMSEKSVENFVNPFALDDDDIGMDTQSCKEVGNEVKEDDLLKVLDTCIKWISNTPPTATSQPTAFRRIKEFWVPLWQEARKCLSAIRVESDSTGLVFFYSDARLKDSIEISLAGLKETVSALTKETIDILRRLLPSEMKPEEFRVTVSDLKDHPKRVEGVFEQNAAVFEDLVQKVYDGLMKDEEERFRISHMNDRRRRVLATKNEGHQKWLDLEENLLKHLLCTICLTSGIPPRSFQLADFRYTSSADAKRNLYILKSTVVIGWPRSKSFNRTIQAALWALPSVLGEALLLYLGVIRRVSITFTKAIGRVPAVQTLTHFFVTAPSVAGEKRVNQPIWTGSQINRVLKTTLASSPLEAELTPSILRHVCTAIYKTHFPQMINPNERNTFMKEITSIVNRQGDHNQLTVNQNYAIGNGEFNLTDAEIDQFFVVSFTFQAVVGSTPDSRNILENLRKLPDFVEAENQKIAMDRARILVMTKYQVRGKEEAESVLADRPFSPKAGLEKLGDGVLLEVLAFLQFGHGIPDPLATVNPNGCPTHQVAEAFALIMLALMEHIDGKCYEPAFTYVRASIDKHKRSTIPSLEKVRDEEEEKWIELSVAAFEFKSNRARDALEGPNMMKYMDLD